MKPSIRLRHFLLIAGSSLLASTPALHAADGTWDVDANGTWSTTGNWSNGIVADASTFAANFTNDITGDRTVSLDGDRTLTSVVFGDSDTATAGSWILDNNGVDTNNLILSGTGAGITVNALGTNKTATVSAIIQGSAGLVKSGTGTLILSGANTYTGTNHITLGTVQVNSGGTLGATNAALRIGTGTSSTLGDAANLTLNTSAQVAAFTVTSNTSDTTTASNINQLSIASGSTLTASSFSMGISTTGTVGVNTALSTGSTPGAGGTLTVTGTATFGLQGPDAADANITWADLRGLHTFNSGALNVGAARNSRGTLYLANNANTINGNINVGSSGGTNNYNIAGTSYLYLGAGTNKLQATTITIGAVKGAGQILFAGSNGSVEITGPNGIGTSTINVGSHGASSYQGTQTNSLLLAGHTATVAAGAVTLGQITSTAAGGNTLNSLLTFDTGTFNATSLTMGLVGSNRTGLTHAINSEFRVGGDTANSAATGIVNISGNVLLGNNDGTGTSTGATSGTLTINGGTVNVNTAAATTGGIFDSSANVVVGVSLTSTLTLDGGTLDLNGGRIGGIANTNSVGARNIDNLNFRSGTLIDVRSINENQGLTKTTGGTLTLAGTNTYTGATTIEAGTLALGASNALPTTSVIIGAGTLDAATYTDTTGTLDVTEATSTINLGSGAVLSFAASNGVDWTGGTLNITGSFVSGVSLRFGTSNTALTSGLSSQLAAISAAGFTNFRLNASGYLIADVVGGSPYEAWAGGAAFDADTNGDGVKNGLAFLLGAISPTSAVTVPTVTQSGGNLVLSFNMLKPANRGTATLSVQHSRDLGIGDAWTTVPATDINSGPTNGVTFVITPGVGTTNGIQATIGSAEAGGTGKLFGRLKGAQP